MDKKKIMQKGWKEMLELDELPRTDESFFDLGGNSFIASKICQLYAEKTGDEIEIADFYEKETIEELV